MKKRTDKILRGILWALAIIAMALLICGIITTLI